MYTIHVEELPAEMKSCVEVIPIFNEFEHVFQYVLGFPPERDIDFTINLVLREPPASKAPYRMSTPQL